MNPEDMHFISGFASDVAQHPVYSVACFIMALVILWVMFHAITIAQWVELYLYEKSEV